jgi:hypothetical protein
MITVLLRRFSLLLVAAAGLVFVAAACTSPTAGSTPTSATRTPGAEAAGPAVSLTVYNQGTALVRDHRQFDLVQGINDLAFRDVAASIDPTTVLFKSLSDPAGTWVLEQNYEYDLVGAAALLEKYVDQSITVVTKDGKEYRGTLLSGRGDVILQGSDGGVTVLKLDNVQNFAFPQLPEGLRTRPTLLWRVQAAHSGTQDVEVTYLTGGLSWRADYVLLLAQDSKSVDLDGWVTLNNTSGATFRDAQLKLIAGDLQRVNSVDAAKQVLMEATAAPTPAAVEQRSFFEYHLYQVPRPVTVRDNETKQIQFVSVAKVPAGKFFVYDGAQCQSYAWYCRFYGSLQTDQAYGVVSNPKVMTMVEFDTKDVKADMPAGRVRVYQQDIDGAALLVGEDTIDHTPKGETVRLYVGDAFDIVGERKQTDFRRPSANSLEETFEVTLRNHKTEAVEVRVVEHLARWSEWRILGSNADYTKPDSSTIEFRVSVPANGQTQVHYTARYDWP